jgi:hypothetical protein
MKVSILNEDKNLAYEAFLQTHKAAMLYYSIKFKGFLEKQTKSDAMYLVAIDDNDQIQGILPLMIKTGPLGKVLNSLPYYGSNGGILANLKEAKDLLLEKYLEIANSGEYVSATLIENPLDKDYSYDRIIADESDFRIGQLTNISGNFTDLEGLMVRFDSKTRNIIRKAIKSDVKVAIENDQFDFLRDTHFDNMESIGGLAKEDTFFENVLEFFEAGVDYDIYVSRKDNIPVAATLVFYYGKVVEYYTPVIVKEYRSFQPLSLIITTAMFNASALGFEWWNWGGTWQSQGGVYDFKSKWGTVDINYNYHIILKDKSLYQADKEDLLRYYGGFYVLPFGKLAV